MKQLVQRVLVALAATFAVVYLGDWAIFQIARRSAFDGYGAALSHRAVKGEQAGIR